METKLVMYDVRNIDRFTDPTIKVDQKSHSNLHFSNLGIYDVSDVKKPKSVNINDYHMKTEQGDPITVFFLKDMIDELSKEKKKN